LTKADQIRALSDGTRTVAEIAAHMGVPYQHVDGVLRRSGLIGTTKPTMRAGRSTPVEVVAKPELSADTLLRAGFQRASGWAFDHAGSLVLTDPLPKEVGVYAFVKLGVVMYVGVATMGLAKRIYFYGKPGVSQRTSLRLNAIIREEIGNANNIDILIAQPEDMMWNGLPVHGAAGLELGLIKAYQLPWNMRSSN
jgi:hypothetical protein